MVNLEYRQEIDGPVYDRLSAFLPDRVFDSHIHTALPSHIASLSDERKVSKLGFFADVASVFGYNSYEVNEAARRVLLPSQQVEGLFFGYPFPETDLDANNAYVAELILERGVHGLYIPRPDVERPELEAALDRGFSGFKPYPDLVLGKPTDDIRVADYIPAAVWQAAHERRAIVLVHLGRPGRLYDPYDIQDMTDACRRYPGARVIIAHIGRPYIPSMIRHGIPEVYKELPNLWFDICPICESGVLEVAIRDLGPGRLLFGSDSPVTYMRGRLGEWKGDRKFFSSMDLPWNVDREAPEREARYTFFMYEQLLGLQRAAAATGLSRSDVREILCDNAKGLVLQVAAGLAPSC